MEEITEVLKYDENNNEIWIYSVKNSNHDDIFLRYYMLIVSNNIPVIKNIKNPIETLQNIKTQPTNVHSDSLDYIRFLALKEIADKNILNKIRK